LSEEPEIPKRVELLAIPQKKYERYSLAKNPFPSVAMAPTLRETQVEKAFKNFCESARKEELDKIWESFVNVAYQDRETANHWIESDVGEGKSAIMIYLAKILKDKMKTDGDIVSIYAPIGNGFSDVYSYIATQLGRDFFENLVYRILKKTVLDDIDAVMTEPTDEDAKKAIKEAVEEDHLVLREIFHPVKEPILPLDLIDPEKTIKQFTAGLAGKIRCTQLIKHTRAKPAILVQLFEEPDVAYQNLTLLYRNFRFDALVDFIALFEEAGYVMTYLFLDQLDHQWVYAHWPRAKQDRIRMNIRLLVVESLGRLAIIATSYPHLSAQFRTDQELMAALPWTEERVTTLRQLSNEDVRAIFSKYLKYERTREDAPELSPFTIGAVDKINEMHRGNIRDILIHARDILKKAADANLETIDAKFVEEQYTSQAT